MITLTEQDLKDLLGNRPKPVLQLYQYAHEVLGLPGHFPYLADDLLARANSRGLHDDVAFHALLLALFRSLSDGSVCLSLREEALFDSLNFLPENLATEYTGNILNNIPKYRRLSRIISDGHERATPLVISRGPDFHPVLFFQRYHRAEEQLKAVLRNQLAAPPLPISKKEADAFSAATGAPNTIPLSEDQKLAVAMALCQRFLVISGGPGTGKTTVVLAIIHAYFALGFDPNDIRLAAPTGRAANRMAESIRRGLPKDPIDGWVCEKAALLEATTVHRLLGFNPGTGLFNHHRNNPLDLKLLVLDEASMVDVSLMAKILEALPPDARIILLGDRDQLPSVEAGAMLSDLLSVPENAVYTYAMASSLNNFEGIRVQENPNGLPHPMADRLAVLTKTHRFNDSMRRISQCIARGDEKVIESIRSGKEGYRFISVDLENEDWWRRKYIMNWFRENIAGGEDGYGNEYAGLIQQRFDEPNKALEQVFVHLASSRVLALTHAGPAGIKTINGLYMDMLRSHLPGDAARDMGMPPGTPILNTRNDHGRRLYNGDTGVVLRDGRGGMRAWFEMSGGYVSWPLEELTTIDPAFAMTVHKAQGSEYGKVLLVLPTAVDHRLLSREIVYTGVTRARNEAWILGTEATFLAALRRRMQRYSTIPGWLADLIV